MPARFAAAFTTKWGSLSRTQREKLPGKLKYFALLLYRYIDQEGERSNLAPFQWQLAVDATLSELEKWLTQDKFQSLKESKQMLSALIHNKIGTDNEEIIEKDIAPKLDSTLVIKLGERTMMIPAKS